MSLDRSKPWYDKGLRFECTRCGNCCKSRGQYAYVYLAPADVRAIAAHLGLSRTAFLARQLWGWMADRIGGLNTVLAGSAAQAAAIGLFLATQDEAGLFAVSAAFGLGFSGIIPAYVFALRQYFPASEAAWRVPTLLFLGLCGMAAGSWLAGAIYAYSKGSISPEVMAIGRSVDGLVMVLLGGVQTLSGPLVGAAVFTWLQDAVARGTDYWRALLGLTILVIVLAFPQGIVGALRRLTTKGEQ